MIAPWTLAGKGKGIVGPDDVAGLGIAEDKMSVVRESVWVVEKGRSEDIEKDIEIRAAAALGAGV